MKREVLYAYVGKDNREFIKSMSKKHCLPMSTVLDHVIGLARKSKTLKLKTHVPKYVKRAAKWKEKNTLHV